VASFATPAPKLHMAVHIRLARYGSKKNPFYRVVVTDQRSPRDGRFLEIIGTFDPSKNPGKLDVKADRLSYWTGVGALPTDTVAGLLRRHAREAGASA
jgi:small subunit ribosomal protein S16